MTENTLLKMEGFVKITDGNTGEILFDGKNSIHYENMSVAIAQSLLSGPINASTGPGFIYQMAFGNGGTIVSNTGIITYLPPNTIGSSAQLYNQTYNKIVNKNFSSNLDPTNNKISYDHISGKAFTDLIISCQLDYNEPSGQLAFDNSNSLNTQYAFDEMGLLGYNGQLLTHVIFSPWIKSANRLVNISYTLRISTLSSLIS